jgi:hypothetical protein
MGNPCGIWKQTPFVNYYLPSNTIFNYSFLPSFTIPSMHQCVYTVDQKLLLSIYHYFLINITFHASMPFPI